MLSTIIWIVIWICYGCFLYWFVNRISGDDELNLTTDTEDKHLDEFPDFHD